MNQNLDYFKKIEDLVLENFKISLSEIPMPPRSEIFLIPSDGLLLGSKKALEGQYLAEGDIYGFFDSAPEGYFLMGFWGHGVNSYAFYYLRVDSKTKIFFRLPYGGVYMDNPKEANRIRNFLPKFFDFERNLKNIKSFHALESMGNGGYKVTLENTEIEYGTIYFFNQEKRSFSKLLDSIPSKEGFKDTEIGLIPKDWDYQSLGELCNFQTGKLNSNMAKEKGIYPFFTCSPETLSINSYSFDCESILLAGNNAEGKFNVKYYNGKFDVYQRTYVITIKDINKLNYFYLYFALILSLDRLRESSQGTATKFLTMKILNSMEIPVPPIDEQKMIGQILADLDQKIELNQEMNRTLEAIGQAIFRHWFVHYEFPDENGQPYKSSGGEMVDSELGEIPAGWKISILKNYVNLITGCSYRSIDLEESDTALVTLKSVGKDGNFKQDGFKEYTGKFKEEQVIEDGDVVVAQTDLTQNADVLGKPVIVRTFPKYKKLIASLDLGIVRPKDSYLNKEFIFNALKTKTFHSHAVSYANGTTVLHLSKDAIPSYNLPIPNKSILNQFEKLITPINNQINNNNLESGNLSEIRDLLLPKLMSGKIRIKIPEEATVK